MILTIEQQREFVKMGLAKENVNGKFSTFKYAKKVMFDYLWDKHPNLKYCRGHTYDNETGKIVLIAPTKSFNYLENGTWKDVPLDTTVTLYKKYNGFMATAAIHEPTGEILVGTTGSTKSSYAAWAREYIAEWCKTQHVRQMDYGTTALFEICHPEDPHIVYEESGAHLLGLTDQLGNFHPAGQVIYATLEEAIGLAKASSNKIEGYMMYDMEGNVCKLKTDYYVYLKKLMRMGPAQVRSMYSKEDFQLVKDRETPEFVNHWLYNIRTNLVEDYWVTLDEQTRRYLIEELNT